jgi:hypothetical protein
LGEGKFRREGTPRKNSLKIPKKPIVGLGKVNFKT